MQLSNCILQPKQQRRQSTADPNGEKQNHRPFLAEHGGNKRWRSRASMSSGSCLWWSWTSGSWIVVFYLRPTCMYVSMVRRMWRRTSGDPCDVTIVTWRQPYHVTSEPPFPISWLRPCSYIHCQLFNYDWITSAPRWCFSTCIDSQKSYWIQGGYGQARVALFWDLRFTAKCIWPNEGPLATTIVFELIE